MRSIVLTVIGDDETGLVKRISDVCLAHEANWLGSNLSYLSGYFAGVIELNVAENHLQSLTDDLEKLAGLEVKVHSATKTAKENKKKAQELDLVITGNDRKGIVQELAAVISHKGANIISFVSRHQSAPNWGGELFHAVAKVSLPNDLDKDAVIEALEQIAADIVVDVELDEAS